MAPRTMRWTVTAVAGALFAVIYTIALLLGTHRHYVMLNDAPDAPTGSAVFVASSVSYAEGDTIVVAVGDQVRVTRLKNLTDTRVVLTSTGMSQTDVTPVAYNDIIGVVQFVLPNYDFLQLVAWPALFLCLAVTALRAVALWSRPISRVTPAP
ncbi:MAG TPA: hypothetical protein VLG40_02590 [Candidatus Saccharimonas sp.]|nr:hypothetical protein [Candidatus Saccharimonas sp.]